MARMGVWKRSLRLALAGGLALAGLAARADDDERLAARVAKIDPLFQKALAELAKKYDAEDRKSVV